MTAGQAGDAPHAMDLPAGQKRGAVKAAIGDRGYDSGAIVAKVRRLRARVVIPPVARRTKRRRYSKVLYEGRNVVERFWSTVKQCRRVATRFDKLDVGYRAFVHWAAILVVSRHP